MRIVTRLLLLALLTLVLTSPAAAQFGRVDDAVRRAADAVKKPDEAKKPDPAKPEAKEAAKPPEKETPAAASAGLPATQASPSTPSFQAYSKYDFVPGEKVVAVDDFTQDAIGDFPDKGNTDGSGEIVTIDGKAGRWL